MKSWIALLIFILAPFADAGEAPKPFSADPYERIGATRTMTEQELRHAYLVALNRFDPGLTGPANEEAHARILEAGHMLFSRTPEASNDNAPQTDVVDLAARRMQKLYAPFVEALQAMRDHAPPVDHSDWHRTDAELALKSRLEDLAGSRGPIKFVEIRKTFDDFDQLRSRVSRTFALLNAADKATVIEKVLRDFLERAQGKVKTKDVISVAAHISTPSVLDALFTHALGHASGKGQIYDLLAASPLSEALYIQALGSVYTLSKGHIEESRFLETFLRSRILNRLKTSYDRAETLQALEPFLTLSADQRLVAALSDIAHAEWLPADTTGAAFNVLRRWQFTGLGRERSLETPLEVALGPKTPSAGKPLRVCMALLLGGQPGP
ncbi:MAG: hypothetical protein HY074_12975 [Deltaproteobacteria bacterium]|nr:hypothetical protein [Deltaproteobacteria bacterium]